jgi:DNA-binding LacI/PurR family transcriptional regulator
MSRKRSTTATLTTIAQHLNCSIATVSRALHNGHKLNPETVRRVEDAAQTMGYTSPPRRVKESALHHNILTLTQSSNSRTNQDYLVGMSRASISLNLSILSHHLDAKHCADILVPAQQPMPMRQRLVDGLVLIHRWPDEVVQALSRQWPLVSIIHEYPDVEVDYVGVDDRLGFYRILRHLHDGGHRRVGFFGLCPEISWSRARFAAYVEGLIYFGWAYHPEDAVKISLEKAQAPHRFDMAVLGPYVQAQMQQGVDAWVCSSIVTAYSLCHYLLDQGVRIPEQVAVVGYHAQCEQPPGLPQLTSTRVDDEELGACSLRRLIHRLYHPKEPSRSILLPPELVMGETSRWQVNGKT